MILQVNTIEPVRWDLQLVHQEDVELRVRRVAVSESLSGEYRAVIECVQFRGDDLGGWASEPTPDGILGQEVCLSGIRRATRHTISGVVTGVTALGQAAAMGGHGADRAVLRLVIEPAFAYLRQIQHSRVFQHQTLPEVATQVLKAGLSPFGRSVELRLNGEYPQREMVIQYEETDAVFVARILDEAGVDYYFEYSDDGPEKLVLVDELGKDADVSTLAGEGRLTVAGEDVTRDLVEGAASVELMCRSAPAQIVVSGRDWTRPDVSIDEAVGESGAHQTMYLQDGRISPGNYGENLAYHRHEGALRAQVEFGQTTADAFVLRGTSNAVGLIPGHRVELMGHRYDALNAAYVVVEVEHSGLCPGDELISVDRDEERRYSNRFTCVPVGARCPRVRRQRPAIPSIQTATVVGPDGEEIYTDAHGRVRVRFHWDQTQRDDNDASAWIRVAQAWSGAGFGAVFLPRIGTEVVVSFINGDPDRPLVTGCVYHGATPLPVDLPAKSSQSVIRTRSTPGGEGYNELRFEDRCGAEKISVHAQKDLIETVRNQHRTKVYGEQHNVVERDQIVKISGSQICTVESHRTLIVDAGEDVTIENGRTTTVSGIEVLKVKGTRDVHVDENETHVIVGNLQHEVHGRRFDVVEKGYCLKVKSGVVDSKEGWGIFDPAEILIGCCEQNTRSPHASMGLTPDVAEIGHGESRLVVERSGVVELRATKRLSLVCGDARIDLLQDGTINLSESKSGTSTISLRPGEIKTSSLNLESSAQNTHTIAGTLVRIN